MRKINLLFLSLLILSLLFASHSGTVFAKKKIVLPKSGTAVTGGGRLIVTPRLRRDRKALIVNLSNLGAVSSLSYELTYMAGDVSQGVAGTITPKGELSAQRELLFGTCSKNVCRYHTNITGMRFVVTSTLKSGGKVRKAFTIKP